MSRDIPIIFSAPMVQALLEGRKQQTRRLAWRKETRMENLASEQIEHYDVMGCEITEEGDDTHIVQFPSSWQRAKVGDRIWVKENFYQRPDSYWYAVAVKERPAGWKMTPSIFMPRKLSRLTLEVTAVKIETLNDISSADAFSEGCNARGVDGDLQHVGNHPSYSLSAFRELWCSLNGVESWIANPDVVALTFKVHNCNIDRMSP